MDVTKDNFDALLPEILESIDKCCMLSIDCEFSGLSVNDEKDNYFETVEDRYNVLRKSASQFLVLQFGLCPFFYDSAKDEFSYKVYNFFTFPRNIGKDSPNIRFLCEGSSLEFLASCGFDFNKVVYKGIPYLTFPNEEKMRQYVEKRTVFLAEENSITLSVPESLRSFMEDTEEQVKRLKLSQMKEISLSNLSNYQRKLIFHNIKPKYSNQLYFETVVANESESSNQSNSAVVEKNGKQSPTDNPTKSMPGEIATPKSNEKVSATPNRQSRVLRISKLTEEEQATLDAEKKQIEMDTITKLVGFSKVIRKISQSNKLVVGHNMLLDVSHTIHQFITDLPPSLAEFKFLVQSTFSNLIDTKLMAASHPFRELITSTVLNDLLKKVHEEPFHMPAINHAGTSEGYDLHGKKQHEAGYDAYVTGLCFLGMIQYLGSLHSPKKCRVLPDSPLVMPFLNKLFLMRMLDITYLNISGTDLTPSRSHVFYVTCPAATNSKSILSWFNAFGVVQVWWRSDTSLFVALNDKDQSPFVMSNIEAKTGFTVMPFEQYQKNQVEKKRPRLSRSPGPDDSVIVAATSSTRPELKNKRHKTDNSTEGSTEPVKQLFQEPIW